MMYTARANVSRIPIVKCRIYAQVKLSKTAAVVAASSYHEMDTPYAGHLLFSSCSARGEKEFTQIRAL